jgi:type II secretory pathway pseudopilin PulG
MTLVMGPRTPRSSEAGFALVEVIVAAAVLAIVALAVLSGIDGATAASTREKARAVASDLAEQDQERLRAMPVDVLKDPPQMNKTGDVPIDGVMYKVKSEAKFITDDLGGEPACGASSSQVEYLHIVTTVTSAVVGSRIPAVTVDSLVSPTTDYAEDHGALGVKIVDRSAKKGVQGITVTATSPTYSPPAEVTDATGCVVFNSMPVGTYTVTVNQPNYVGRDLNQKATLTGTVVRKTVSFVQLQYDRAVTIRASFKTHTPGTTFSTAAFKPSTATYVSATNGAYVGMLRRVKSNPAATAIDSTGLYPYTENAYTFFAGECGYTSPETYNKNYFSTTNINAAIYGDPVQPQPQPATVYEPPVNVRVMNLSSTASVTSFNDTDVLVYAKLQKPSTSTDSCDEDSYPMYTMPWPTLASLGWPSVLRTGINHWLSSVNGTYDPGMPFGKYRFCVIDLANKKYAVTGSDYDNTSPDGGAALDIAIATTGTAWKSYTGTPAPTTCGFSS